MPGSDGDEEAPASLADLATFKQEMANEIAQLQAALQRSMNDMIEASRCPAHGGGSTALAVVVFPSASALSVVAAPVLCLTFAPSCRVQISQRPGQNDGGGGMRGNAR